MNMHDRPMGYLSSPQQSVLRVFPIRRFFCFVLYEHCILPPAGKMLSKLENFQLANLHQFRRICDEFDTPLPVEEPHGKGVVAGTSFGG
jgi:hypothetical protein